MSRATSRKPLTPVAIVAVAGLIGLAPVGASAASLNLSVRPTMGHAAWVNNLGAGLSDQVRYPKIQGQILTDDPGTVIHGGHPPVHIIHNPGHPKPNHRN
jgi:hypothetical protein